MNDNLQGRIDDYLDQVFGPYEDCPSVAELRIEVRQNLLERLSDLVASGVGDEVAYAQVISSMGDMRPMVAELVAQDRREEPTPPIAEPTGDAKTIPASDGEAPGASWTADPSTSSEAPGDWGAWVSGIVGRSFTGIGTIIGRFADAEQAAAAKEALKAAEEEVNYAMGRVEDEITRVGARLPFWGSSDWQKQWQEEHLARASYRAADLRNADFAGKDLTRAQFAASALRKANFANANLTGARLAAADLSGANLSQANLTGANLSSATLREVIFEGTNLTKARLNSANLRNVTFTGAIFRDTKVTYADLRGVRFADCLFERANFTGSDLRGACFDGLGLDSVIFSMCNLKGASFRGAHLTNLSFRHISRRVIASIIFEDTVVDQATYAALVASGCFPSGVRVVG
ncbi:MAG: pentapeptide repeat-containing protein [Propionibacteriaceae bacterium]|nr:pentapeptide repeat-containing protein [Propionibacteriaceae bacterium]